jgi:hypothetical protein
MGKLEDWQPIFRFLEKLDNSDFVGLAFSTVCLIGVLAGWYWVCFKNGAEVWKAGIVSWNKRFGINLEWIPPFALKIFVSVFLFGSILGLSLALLSKINRQSWSGRVGDCSNSWTYFTALSDWRRTSGRLRSRQESQGPPS